ncbi:MAG TPA: hypothetical protein VE957_08265 [Terriglobales bacterium]|nr:hypothetical protein [Terriglobales bacterium]
MGTGTQTSTFTVVDIRRVVENFAADFAMIGESTGLQTRDQVASTVQDLGLFAELGYLLEISVFLETPSGAQPRARKYSVSQTATGWATQMPGDNLWPKMPNTKLRVIATFTNEWWQMSEEEKQKVRLRFGIEGTWALTNTDTSFRHLTGAVDRRYASNGYGMERKSYQ